MASKGERVALGKRHVVTELATDVAALPASAQTEAAAPVQEPVQEPVQAEKPKVEEIWLSRIRVDGGTQNRASLTESLVNEYCEEMEQAGGWGPFPPIKLTYDGEHYWLTDGFHRVAAARKLIMLPNEGRQTSSDLRIPALVEPGTLRDAVLRSLSANRDHGLRRSNADKRRAVTRMLTDTEYGWSDFTDGVIAGHCAVSSRFVGQVRADLEAAGTIAPVTARVGADGRTIQVEKIGRTAPTPPPPTPTRPAPPPATPPLTPPAMVENARRLSADAVVVRLATVDPHSDDFEQALHQASAEQLQAVLQGMRARHEHVRGGQVAAARWSRVAQRHEQLAPTTTHSPARKVEPLVVPNGAAQVTQPSLLAPVEMLTLRLPRAAARALYGVLDAEGLRLLLHPDDLAALHLALTQALE